MSNKFLIKPKIILKDKKRLSKYYDIIITNEGNIFIQPYGSIVDSFVKRFNVPKKNRKLNTLCG